MKGIGTAHAIFERRNNCMYIYVEKREKERDREEDAASADANIMARGGNLEFAERERNRSFAADHQVDDYLRRNLSPFSLSLLPCFHHVHHHHYSTINIGGKRYQPRRIRNGQVLWCVECVMVWGIQRRLFLFEHPRKIWTLRWSRLPFGSIGVVVD